MTGRAEDADSLEELRTRLRSFARARDWEQFHNPKNLAMALTGEVGELVEIFQWLTADEAGHVMEGPRAEDVENELADVFIYLLRMADVLGVDLAEATQAKLERNEDRYPVPHVRGRADRAPQT
jgi:dCTP diphosphatase